MFLSRDKDDDDDFVPNPNYHSNLASIFGSSRGSGGNNSSLTYVPPKQPRRQNKPSTIAAPTSSAARSSSLLCAKIVQTFKMVDGAYQSQGKLGVAVLCYVTEESTSYQILLYRDKQNQVSTARIVREFNFHIQPKNYCTFYDKQNAIWSILFDNPADMAEFNLQVAKCRWKAEQTTCPILVQDLWCPILSGDSATSSTDVGDTVELAYSVSTLDDPSEEMKESQRVLVDVEATGWKQALVGTRYNTQRVIILQPFMLGDLNLNEVVYNTTVVVKFTVLQVIKPSTPDPATNPLLAQIKKSDVKEAPKPEPALPDISDQKSTESPRSPKSTKAELINRMARMGQALPFKKAGPTPSDSDETEQEDRKSPMHRLSKVAPKPRARMQSSSIHRASSDGPENEEPPSLPPPVAITPHVPVPVQWATGVQPYMVGNMYPVPQVSSPLDNQRLESQSQFNMFLSEVRTTNSELRMGLTRLTDKVETLQNKVEDSKNMHPSQGINSVLEKLMEGEQQLKEQLQQVLSTLQTTQLASQSRAIAESAAQQQAQPSHAEPDPPVVEPCHHCAELHQAHVSLSEEVKKLQEENEVLQVSLTAQKDALFNAKVADKDQLSRIETLQRQLSEEQRSVSELNNSLESLQRVKEILADDLETANNSIVELQNTLQEKQTSIDRLEQALKESDATKLEEVRRNLQEVLDPKPIIGDHIKKILNAVYRLVKVQFEPQNKYDANFIQSVLAETIKAVTLEYLQNGDLISLERATPAVSVQSVPETSGQAKSEDLRTLYIGREQRSSTTDFDCKSSVFTSSMMTISSEHPSESSLISQPNNLSPDKAEKSHSGERSNGFIEKDRPLDNTSIAPPSSAVDTTDDSSDDCKSLLSVKLETVLLHLAQSQTMMSEPLPHSCPPSQSSWQTYRE